MGYDNAECAMCYGLYAGNIFAKYNECFCFRCIDELIVNTNENFIKCLKKRLTCNEICWVCGLNKPLLIHIQLCKEHYEHFKDNKNNNEYDKYYNNEYDKYYNNDNNGLGKNKLWLLNTFLKFIYILKN